MDFEPNFDTWREHARRLLVGGVPPASVEWQPRGGPFQAALPLLPTTDPALPRARHPVRANTLAPRVPKAFVDVARGALCHRSPDRWSLAYRLLWRLTHGEARLLDIEIDPDVLRFRALAKEVRRDCHKMKAFVRFRRVERYGEEGKLETWYIAWHRPDHLIVERVAPFFVERFNDQRWSILTPEAAAHWDLRDLRIGPGVAESEAPDGDQLEDLWRTYYAHIFNPARLKVRAMKAELPVRHWATLPEAELIPGLIRDARGRTADMLEDGCPPASTWISPDANLSDLAAALPHCKACDLCGMGRPVFGEGPVDARILLVGEQPGDQEERAGRPFVGPAGEVLNRALKRAGIDREQIYITNSVKHFKHRLLDPGPSPTRGGTLGADSRGPRAVSRPDPAPDPKARQGQRRLHRTPSMTEVTSCRPWLEAELERVRPEVVVCLGVTAGRALLGGEVRLRRDRGRPRATTHAPFTLLTDHPAALLRIPDPVARRTAEDAFVADLRRAAAQSVAG